MGRSLCALIVRTPKRGRRPSTAQELSVQTRPRLLATANLGSDFLTSVRLRNCSRPSWPAAIRRNSDRRSANLVRWGETQTSPSTRRFPLLIGRACRWREVGSCRHEACSLSAFESYSNNGLAIDAAWTYQIPDFPIDRMSRWVTVRRACDVPRRQQVRAGACWSELSDRTRLRASEPFQIVANSR